MTTEEKQVIVSAMQAVVADVRASVASEAADTLGKSIDDITSAGTNEEILEVYDALAAYRFPVVSTMSPQNLVTEMRAEP